MIYVFLKVGLMREGRLLAEAPPNVLLETYGLTTLEDVFLKLCLSFDGIAESVPKTAVGNTQSHQYQASSRLRAAERRRYSRALQLTHDFDGAHVVSSPVARHVGEFQKRCYFSYLR
jgi:hypothetical protein